jgi:hypothetical protein
MYFWANVFWANGVWANVFLSKCLSEQMSFWANVVWANVSGQMSLGKCRMGKCHGTIIDVTITFPRTRVGEWHVMSRPTMSDYRYVSFVLDSRNQGVILAGRNYFKADWTKFNSDMNLADSSWSTEWSGQKIEERLKHFTLDSTLLWTMHAPKGLRRKKQTKPGGNKSVKTLGTSVRPWKTKPLTKRIRLKIRDPHPPTCLLSLGKHKGSVREPTKRQKLKAGAS